MRILITTSFLVILLQMAGYSQPVNDECVNATTITVSTSGACVNGVTGTTIGATQSMAPCAGTTAKDAWFKFVATQSSEVFNCVVGLSQPVIEVFSGTCGSLTSIGCINPPVHNGKIRQLVSSLTIGDTYYVRVYSKDVPDLGGNFVLCIYEPTANDDCSGAINIPLNTGTNWNVEVGGINYYASPSLAFCNGTRTNDADTWFKFVASDSIQLIAIRETHNSSGATQIQTYSGDCNSLAVLDGVRYDNLSRSCYFPGGSSADGYYKLQNLVAGNTYYVRVMSDYAAGTIGTTDSFYLSISNVPSNDACIGAIDVPVNSNSNNLLKISGNLKNASIAPVVTSCANSFHNDLWYKFTATSTRHLISLQAQNTDLMQSSFEVYRNGCGSLQSIYCGSGSGKWRFADISGLTIGNTYYIRTYVINPSGFYNALEQPIELSITTPDAVLQNNDCSGAISLNTGESVLGTVLGGTVTAGTFSCTTAANGSDVWFSMTPTTSGTAVLVMNFSNTAPFNFTTGGIEVYTGACGSLSSQVCSNTSTPASVNVNVLANQQYFIRVYSNSSSSNGMFNLFASQVFNLPVHLTSFDASVVNNNYAQLVWKTAEESGINYYEVQKSTDGSHFTAIGRVTSINSALPFQYHFEDRAPWGGKNYYQLKIVNQDGKVDNSKVVSIDYQPGFTDNLQVYRTGDKIGLRNNSTVSKIVIFHLYNAQGQLLYKDTRTIVSGSNELNIPVVLKDGNIYLIKITGGNAELKTFKLLW